LNDVPPSTDGPVLPPCQARSIEGYDEKQRWNAEWHLCFNTLPLRFHHHKSPASPQETNLPRQNAPKVEQHDAVKPVNLAISVPLILGISLAIGWALPTSMRDMLYQEMYLPYIRNEPIVMHPHEGVDIFAAIPSLLTAPLLGFKVLLGEGQTAALSRWSRYLERGIAAGLLTSIAAMVLTFPLNAYFAHRIEVKGYSHCHYLDGFGVSRRIDAYVIDPMLCVRPEKLPRALERYQQTNAAAAEENNKNRI